MITGKTGIALGSARPPGGRFGVRMLFAARPEAGPYPKQLIP
jgi:hypothetical protein